MVASWNLSAINNNPFEYWVTHTDPEYNKLMTGVQSFIDSPERDLPIHEVFTDEMFAELRSELEAVGIGAAHLDALEAHWNSEYRSRMAVGGFLKDKQIGVKRLASLPDRITNTIHLADGGTCLRPTVINAYDGPPLSSMHEWWALWRDFMFRTSVQVSPRACRARRLLRS
jgi:hypothetical protein